MSALIDVILSSPPYLYALTLLLLGLIYRFAGAIVDEAGKYVWELIKATIEDWRRCPPRL